MIIQSLLGYESNWSALIPGIARGFDQGWDGGGNQMIYARTLLTAFI